MLFNKGCYCDTCSEIYTRDLKCNVFRAALHNIAEYQCTMMMNDNISSHDLFSSTLLFYKHCEHLVSATSDGTLEGLENLSGGVCQTKGMKVTLKVGQSKYFTTTAAMPSCRKRSMN